jgi:hypothetical protein
MTYVWLVGEIATDTKPCMLEKLQNRVLANIGIVSRCTPARDSRMAFTSVRLHVYNKTVQSRS